MKNKGSFTDERGVITDLFQSDGYSITHITFKKGAVRGNHFHKETTQYDKIVKGRFIVAGKDGVILLEPGEDITIYPNDPHAYLAITDGEIISTCEGKRVGTNYEEDTFRLKKPLL